jgi:hypothetical protein
MKLLASRSSNTDAVLLPLRHSSHLPALLALRGLEGHVPGHHAHVIQARPALHACELQSVAGEGLVMACG